MRTIALEEHFVTKNFLQAVGGMPPNMQRVEEALLDLGEGRIAAMDAGGVSLQVLSLAANGLDKLDAATETSVVRDCNDELAAAVDAHPDRFAGFATLAMKDPARAAEELERCVVQLGFVGVMLDGTSDGEFMDLPKYLPVFEAAAALDVPVYLHPAAPPDAVKAAYFSHLKEPAGQLLSIAGWGWHAEMGLHVLRLIVSGLFERLPELKLIVGHMGEGVPYALARSSKVLELATKDLSYTVMERFKQSVWVTTSGYFTLPPLRCAIDVLGVDRMMYSVDYPFSPNTVGMDYLAAIRGSGLMGDGEFEGFSNGVAEALLNLPPTNAG